MFTYDGRLWHNADFIKTDFINYFDFKTSPWGEKRPRLYQHTDLPAGRGLPIFLKDFKVSNPSSARLVFTALGCVKIYINGRTVGNDEMCPGWSDYHKRTLYFDYDVTGYIKNGRNRIVIAVAPGWYSGRITGGTYGAHEPAVMACLTVSDENGETACVTDGTWLAKTGGQILSADIWDGEYRDARLSDYFEMSDPYYDVSDWDKAQICDYFEGEITAFTGPPVKARENLFMEPQRIAVYNGTEDNGTKFGAVRIVSEDTSFPFILKKGEAAVIDMGQESTGRLALTLRGERGTTVKTRYAEFLNDSGDENRGNDGAKGSVYTVNLRSALAKTHYVAAGTGEETYRPTFTFFGYRYAEVTADGDVELISATAEVIGNDINEIGNIETSDEHINRLISNIIWGQRSNYLSVPTDCPQRDERYGWTGDAQVFSITAGYNAYVYDFFRKWLQDMRDSQSEDGEYSDIVPRVSIHDAGNASAWADAGVIIPYNMYMLYGNSTVLEECWDSMEKYIEGLINKYGMSGGIPRFGDWLSYDQCKNEFISSAYFVRDLELMKRMSDALGKEDRKEYYENLHKDALGYFKKNFMKNGRPLNDTQTEYSLIIAFDLAEGAELREAGRRLAQKVRENGCRLSTGFLGTYNICPALSKAGEDNLAYTLLMQRNEPSWLYSVDQGATTVWERWNSYTIKDGFGDVGMNSFNHYAYGAVEEWMYRFMAGIEPVTPGFKKILLQPRVDTRTDDEIPEGQKRMKWVSASYNSSSGLIESSWENEDSFVYECSIPEGTSAVLMLPVFSDNIFINGEMHRAEEFREEKGCAVITLSEGKYIFEEV